jgi:hypothetical protein
MISMGIDVHSESFVEQDTQWPGTSIVSFLIISKNDSSTLTKDRRGLPLYSIANILLTLAIVCLQLIRRFGKDGISQQRDLYTVSAHRPKVVKKFLGRHV